MATYPAAFGADVTNDGLEDILISPNVTAGGMDIKNVKLYKMQTIKSAILNIKAIRF